MAKYKLGVAALLGAAIISVGAGCGGSDPKEAETPASAVTVTNGAETSAATTTEAGGGSAKGDVAAGKTFFESTCQTCHPAGGTAAGVGPMLTATALDEAGITKQITNGKGAMPGGLASGADLENVTAYVLSIKK